MTLRGRAEVQLGLLDQQHEVPKVGGDEALHSRHERQPAVGGGPASRKIVPLLMSASSLINPPAPSRAMSSIVGGGAAASSSVQIAVSTVDLPLEASPTSAHTEPGANSSSRAARYP